MEEQEDIEFSEILAKAETVEENLQAKAPTQESDADRRNEILLPASPIGEQMDWGTKLILGFLLSILLTGIVITIYLLNLPKEF